MSHFCHILEKPQARKEPQGGQFTGSTLIRVPPHPHELRRTFMAICEDLGYPMAIGDALLGHSLGKICDTYLHLDSQAIMAMASQETADWVEAAMAGQKVNPCRDR